jgi:trk system potassium uptake protein TrkH
MHKRFVANIVARMGVVGCLFMFLPLGWALYDNPQGRESYAFDETILIGLAISVFFMAVFRLKKEDYRRLNAKDGLAIVGFSWIYLSLIGALPFYLSGVVPTYTDALFEVVSGYTTTGASIFTDVEVLPRGILFWRALTHWLGGMGIIVLYIALLPALGPNAYKLYKAESSTAQDRIEPRLRETAKSLWIIYATLTVAQIALLVAGDMPFFDAICHTFATLATGGYSTKNASIGGYSPYIQWVFIVFMFLAGTNFVIHYQLMRGRLRILKYHEEFHCYALIIFSAVLFSTLILAATGQSADPLRDSAFTVVSLMTATGLATADYDRWPDCLRFLLVLLMVIGGCSSSTSGGMKVIRFYLGIKLAFRSIVQNLFPNVVKPIKLDNRPVPSEIINAVMSYFIIFMFLFLSGALIFCILEDCNIETAFSASIACLSNVGPGLSKVGPMTNYAWVSDPGKLLLIFLMMAGRLEVYAMLVLVHPMIWKK